MNKKVSLVILILPFFSLPKAQASFQHQMQSKLHRSLNEIRKKIRKEIWAIEGLHGRINILEKELKTLERKKRKISPKVSRISKKANHKKNYSKKKSHYLERLRLTRSPEFYLRETIKSKDRTKGPQSKDTKEQRLPPI